MICVSLPGNNYKDLFRSTHFGKKPYETIACSKRSDSGERCGVEKVFTLHRSPLAERLEQANETMIVINLVGHLVKT